MNFQGLGEIRDFQFYLDVAFNAGSKAAQHERDNTKNNDRLNKSKDIELARIKVARAKLEKQLRDILIAFPSLDGMTEFYQELVRTTLDYEQVKKSLGAVNWAANQVAMFGRKFELKLKGAKELPTINMQRRAFFGRASSILKQIGPELRILENARKTMKTFPSIKQKLYTAAIAGFPNVGKSTLLAKLTGSKPQIQDYEFTTKTLNVATFGETVRVQCIDTPGTLNRADKMNSIERLADVALKYEADIVVFVFDPTYDEKKQFELLNKLKELDKEMLIYVSKTDLKEAPEKLGDEIIIDSEDLKRELISRAKKEI